MFLNLFVCWCFLFWFFFSFFVFFVFFLAIAHSHALGDAGGAAGVSAVQGVDRRRHGHEHGLQGLRALHRGAAGVLPRHAGVYLSVLFAIESACPERKQRVNEREKANSEATKICVFLFYVLFLFIVCLLFCCLFFLFCFFTPIRMPL